MFQDLDASGKTYYVWEDPKTEIIKVPSGEYGNIKTPERNVPMVTEPAGFRKIIVNKGEYKNAKKIHYNTVNAVNITTLPIQYGDKPIDIE